MAVKYSFRLSRDYLTESVMRSRSVQRSRWLRWLLKALCAIGLLALLALGIGAEIPVVVGVAAFFLLLLAFGSRFDYWVFQRRWRQLPLFNEPVELTLADEDVTYRSPTTTSVSKWSRYRTATEFKDGLLCSSSVWDYFWLPDSGIVEGTPDEARALCRQKFSRYHVA